MQKKKLSYHVGILFTIVLFCLFGCLFLPQTTYATTYVNFSDFNSKHWTSLDQGYKSYGVWGAGGGRFYTNAEYSHFGSATFSTAADGSHELTLKIPYENLDTGEWESIVQPTNYLVCADAFYNEVHSIATNGIKINTNKMHSWQIDVDSKDSESFSIDGNKQQANYKSVWPKAATFKDNPVLQAAPMTYTVKVTDSPYVRYSTSNKKDVTGMRQNNGGDNFDDYYTYNKATGQYTVWSYLYMPVLIAVPTNEEWNLNTDGNGSNHVTFNQFFVAFIRENVDNSRPNIKTVDSTDDSNKTVTTSVQNAREDKTRYDYNKTEADYSRTTPAEKLTDTMTFTVHSEIIYKQGWIGSGSSGLDYKTFNYLPVSNFDTKKTIKYTTTLPTITQTKFTPFTLNRNGVSQSGDGGIDSSFIGQTKLAMSVNCGQSLDNTKSLANIQTLNTNADTPFSITFDNNNFGMPDVDGGYDNAIRKLANDTYEMADMSKSYANGISGMHYSDLNFWASIGKVNGQSGVSSLVNNNGTENADNLAFNEKYNKTGTTLRSANYAARFTLAGTCTTDNEQKNTDSWMNNWWVTKYKQSKAYEYGTYYAGKIGIQEGSGVAVIYNPYTVSKATTVNGTAVNGSYNGKQDILEQGKEFTISINADKQTRGLYVGTTSKDFTQPVLYGKWEIKTLGVSG